MAHLSSRMDGPESFPRVRSASNASSIPSVAGQSTAAPQSVNPPPAYIAGGAASQLISHELSQNITVSQPALTLLNAFLDQILYNILSTAGSPRLSAFRTAVPLVLKPRLGKGAIQAADEELKEYIEESDDEESFYDLQDVKSEFHLDLAWKLARLRCMVYTRLGDLEEEDEEEIIEQEQLDRRPGRQSTMRSNRITPAGAIFLTSIIEYIGEQALYYGAQHAQKRFNSAKSKDRPISTTALPEMPDQIVLEEVDVFQVGRDSPLSRLWRSWRRNTRSTYEPSSRAMSPMTPMTPITPVATSPFSASPIPPLPINEDGQHPTAGKEVESHSPSQIPLPMSNNDVNEIEVPGLAREITDESEPPTSPPVPERSARRPKSMVVYPPPKFLPLDPSSQRDGTEMLSPLRSGVSRARSASVPTPDQTSFASPRDRSPGDVVPTTVVKDGEESVFEQDEEEGDFEQKHDESIPSVQVLKDGEAETSHPSDSQVDAVTSSNPDDNAQAEETTRSAQVSNEKEAVASYSSSGYIGAAVGAVSAVAGAIGLGAIANRALNGDVGSSRYASKLEEKPKTIADEFLSPTNHVRPPADAVTGASITSAGDFSNMHIPLERSSREAITPISPANSREHDSTRKQVSHELATPISPLAASDPEDLALSSADEQDHKRSVKRSNRVAAIYEDKHQSALQKNFAAGEYFPLQGGVIRDQNESRYAPSHPLVTAPSGTPISVPPEPMTRPRTANNYEVPGRSSSMKRPSTSYSRDGESKSSEYSQATQNMQSRFSDFSHHSKTSSTNSESVGGAGDPLSTQHVVPSIISEPGLLSGSSFAPQPRPGISDFPQPPLLNMHSSSELPRDATSEDAEESEAQKKSLEIPIRSGETLPYSLSPDPGRQQKFPESSVPPKTSTQELAEFLRTTAPPGGQSVPKSKLSPVPTGITGMRSNGVPNSALPPSSTPSITPSAVSQNLQSSMSKRPKNSNIIPRDARVEQGTTRDLADYARSTGPESAKQLPGIISNRPVTTATSKTVKPAILSKTDAAPPVPPGNISSTTTRSNKAPNQKSNRPKLQARDAAPSKNMETGDLIKFIREGPPTQFGDHRADGNQVPIRRAVDSEPTNGLTAPSGKENTARSSNASTQNSSVVANSVQSSVTSRTGLLKSSKYANGNHVNGATSTQAQSSRQVMQQKDGATTRKQIRAADPYAIPDSDDELDDDDGPTQKSKTQDESLIDFLRNTAPPPGMTAQPIIYNPFTATQKTSVLSAIDAQEPSSAGKVTRSASVGSLRSRKLRKSSAPAQSVLSANSGAQSPTPSGNPPVYQRPIGNAREESPHLSQTGSKLDAYRPTNTTHAAHVERNRKPRVDGDFLPLRRSDDTEDLADYLLNGDAAAEAPQVRRERYISTPVKEEAGFLKFFSRRKSIPR